MWQAIVLAILAALFGAAAVAIAIGTKEMRARDKAAKNGAIGIPGERHYLAVLVGLPAAWFTLWIFVGWHWGFTLTVVLLLVLVGVHLSINDQRREKSESRFVKRNDSGFYTRYAFFGAAFGILLLKATEWMTFGRFVVLSIAAAMLAVGFHRLARSVNDRNAFKADGVSYRTHYRIPGLVTILSGLVVVGLFLLLLPDGNPPALWWWTLVAAIVLAAWMVVCDMLDSKNDGNTPPVKDWKFWHRWVGAPLLALGLTTLIVATTVITLASATDGNGTDNAQPEKELLQDTSQCKAEDVLVDEAYSLNGATPEEFFEYNQPRYILNSDLDAFVYALVELNSDERAVVRDALEEPLAQLDKENGSEGVLEIDLNDPEHIDTSQLDVDGCMDQVAQIVVETMVDTLGNERIEELMTSYLQSK